MNSKCTVIIYANPDDVRVPTLHALAKSAGKQVAKPARD